MALVETIALAVHFQDMDMVGEAVQQSPGQTFRAEYLGPFIERQVGGHQDRAPLVALAEDFEQQLGSGLRERNEAEGGARCVSSARRDLRGGSGATRFPTATMRGFVGFVAIRP